MVNQDMTIHLLLTILSMMIRHHAVRLRPHEMKYWDKIALKSLKTLGQNPLILTKVVCSMILS